MSKRKTVLKIVGIGFAAVLLLLLGCYVSVSFNASGRTFDGLEDVPGHEYGLLLGTSPFTAQGARNFYFENRIKSAVELYKTVKSNGL